MIEQFNLSKHIITDVRADFQLDTIHAGWVKQFIREIKTKIKEIDKVGIFEKEHMLDYIDSISGEKLL